MEDRILRRPEVRTVTGLTDGGINRAMREGTFPLPFHLSDRAVGWRGEEIAQWLDSLNRRDVVGNWSGIKKKKRQIVPLKTDHLS